ncbi:MAG: hypothetical protein ACUVX8_13235 [Candidatus Zipacnadales bacterium]
MEPFPKVGPQPPKYDWRPPHPRRVSYRAHEPWWREPHHWRPRYHHYYYTVLPRYFIYGGWGSGWYDPWWWGNYWWPTWGYGPSHTHIVYHYYDYDHEPAVRERVYFDKAPWMDTELTTTLTDVAIAWTTGDIELIQAHLTPSIPITVYHDWEQVNPWVLAAPVFLDITLEALDSQSDSSFRFVQVEELEAGLAWAVAEHSFRLEGEDIRDATMEFMFRHHDDTWLIEAIKVSPENYWWAEPTLLDDAARESARLFDEMERASTRIID